MVSEISCVCVKSFKSSVVSRKCCGVNDFLALVHAEKLHKFNKKNEMKLHNLMPCVRLCKSR